jgi:hypothetical protein
LSAGQEPAYLPAGIKKVFMRAKVTVRVKRARVNSVFLVQLRKKPGADFRGSTWVKQRLSDVSLHPLNRGSFGVDAMAPAKSGRVGSRNIHSGRTGNAETQWLAIRGS